MEEARKDQEEACEAKSQEQASRASPQEPGEDSSLKVEEELTQRPQEEQVMESVEMVTPQRILNLQRDLPVLVTNIMTAADARELMQRTELEKTSRLRLEQLENDAKSSQEKFEEITRGWSTANQKVIPQELQEMLHNQQKLCSALIEDKTKLIKELQQELKMGDDCYVKDLRKYAEELDLMLERMEDQVKTLTKAYREEVAQFERAYEEESEILLTKDKGERVQFLTELWDKELERLAQRNTKVEKYEVQIQELILTTADQSNKMQLEYSAAILDQERECQKLDATRIIEGRERKQQSTKALSHGFTLNRMKNRTTSLMKKMETHRAQINSQVKKFTERNWFLSERYKRNTKRNEHAQKKIKHNAGAHVQQYEQMWQMIEEEMKQLVEKVLVLDSVICEQHLGITWERPNLAFMEGQTGTPAHQAVSSGHNMPTSEGSQKMKDASVGLALETVTMSTDKEVLEEKKTMETESVAMVEEGELSNEELKKVMELLCDEVGFLMEDKLLNIFALLDKEEQTVVKLGPLLSTLGIKEKDVPQMAQYVLQYSRQQTEQVEEVCVAAGEETSSGSQMTSDLIDKNHVLPALTTFLNKHFKTRESSSNQHVSPQHTAVHDPLEVEAYCDRVGNIISEDKVKLWEAAEKKLNQYEAILTEISEQIPEIQSMEQQNAELRMLLLHSLQSNVDTDLEP